MFRCFSLLKNDNFSTRNLSSPTVFDQDVETNILYGIESPTHEQSYFFCTPSLFLEKQYKTVTNMHENVKFRKINLKYFSKFYFSKMPTVTLCYKALEMKYNHQFCSICEIVGKD